MIVLLRVLAIKLVQTLLVIVINLLFLCPPRFSFCYYSCSRCHAVSWTGRPPQSNHFLSKCFIKHEIADWIQEAVCQCKCPNYIKYFRLYFCIGKRPDVQTNPIREVDQKTHTNNNCYHSHRSPLFSVLSFCLLIANRCGLVLDFLAHFVS